MGHEKPLIRINVVIHVMFFQKIYLKDINSSYIHWEILREPNFSNNKLLYILILLLPFAKCFISVNECLIRKAKTWQYSYFWYTNLRYFFKIKIKYLSSFFHHIKFMIFETVWSRKRRLLSHSATSFCFTDIYWMVILINFSYRSKQVGFKAIAMSFLNFLSQNTYPGESSRPEVVWNRNYQRKSSI